MYKNDYSFVSKQKAKKTVNHNIRTEIMGFR